MITLRQRLFIIVSLVIGLILIILLWLNYRRTANDLPGADSFLSPDSGEVSDPGISAETENSDEVEVESSTAKPFSEELYVRQLAKIFVERFYSFSNQNENGHITDSLDLASPSMQDWLESQMKVDNRDYEGVVTSVFASKLMEKTATTATVTIQTQQIWEKKDAVAQGAIVREEKRRNGRVTLVKIDGKWLVDGLYWDKE